VKAFGLALALGAALFLSALPASAATVEVLYSGTLISVDPAGASRFSVGDYFETGFLLDTTTPDTDGASEFGAYSGVTQFISTFASLYQSVSHTGADQLNVQNAWFGDRMIFYTEYPSAPHVGDFYLNNIFIEFSDPSGAALSSDLMPTDFVGLLSLFPENTATFEFWSLTSNDYFQVVGKFTDAIQIGGTPPVATTPIPAALPLLVSALGGLGFVGLRRRRLV
jgi:hypothetical protein